MTIGKSSRKASVRSSIRAPKFLDKASGFYGRLDEPETLEDVMGKQVEQNRIEDDNRDGGDTRRSTSDMVHDSGDDEREDAGVSDFNESILEDDGETLLQRKPSRHSSRWRRSSRRKQKEGKGEEDSVPDEKSSLEKENPADPHALENNRVMIEAEMEKLRKMEEANEKVGKGREPALVHFPTREDADDQVLIRHKKSGGEEEGEEERNLKREQEKGMKVVKRNTMTNYRKALDRAFRRGWEAFITNLYSVTLTPVTSSSSASSENKTLHKSVLAEFR